MHTHITLSATIVSGDCEYMRKTALGRYVKEKRILLDLTQDAVGKAWGKSQATVSDVERGIVGVDREDIPRLAIALERPVNEVMEVAGYRPVVEPQIQNRVKIAEGVDAEVIDRSGDESLPLKVTPEVRDILVGLARMQNPGR